VNIANEDALTFRLIPDDKKTFLPLLLLADEQEDMIDRYLDRGDLYAMYDGDDLRATAVVTDEGGGVFELKSLAVDPPWHRQGYGGRMVRFVIETYRDRCRTLMVGTGDSPITVPFYERCGFRFSHRLENYFLEHYDHPMYEDGVLLRDAVYLRMDFAE
jgi:GNAT superfamily N-acetyltransferase